MEAVAAHAPYVLISKASELTGYSVKAIRCKIDEGVWVEGREWIKGPDGRRLVSMEGYRRWVERGAASRSEKNPSA